MKAMHDFGLGGHEMRYCRELSQGQRQRVGLARMLLSDAMIWLLDEPFAALDKIGIDTVQLVLQQHLLKGGAVIVSTHQPITLKNIPIATLNISHRGEY